MRFKVITIHDIPLYCNEEFIEINSLEEFLKKFETENIWFRYIKDDKFYEITINNTSPD